MKVVYKKSIIDKLIDVIAEARLGGKEIEKIVLTRVEAYELRRSYSLDISSLGGIFDGVRVEEEGNP